MSFEITVRLDGELETATVMVRNEKVQLSELQKDLCKAFKKPFPATMVSLTVGGVEYDEFHLQPFRDGCPHGECGVKFWPTDTPYFYDLADRKSKEPTLEEVMNPLAPRTLPALGGLRLLF